MHYQVARHYQKITWFSDCYSVEEKKHKSRHLAIATMSSLEYGLLLKSLEFPTKLRPVGNPNCDPRSHSALKPRGFTGHNQEYNSRVSEIIK